MNGRLMLLHNEAAGGDSADSELLVTLHTHAFHVNGAELAHQRVDRRRGALGVQEQTPVRARPYPAEEAELPRTLRHVLDPRRRTGSRAQRGYRAEIVPRGSIGS